MAVPLGRGVRRCLMEAALRRTGCFRQIHARNAVRSAAMATQTAEIPSDKAARTLKSKNVEHLSKKSARKTRSREPSASSMSSDGSLPDPLRTTTATSTESPSKWTRKSIIAAYPLPTEEQLPTKIKVKQKQWNWSTSPLAFITNGLGLPVKFRRISSKTNQRTHITMTWDKLSESAIGDGETKVSYLPRRCLPAG
jgi:hypothetical protein